MLNLAELWEYRELLLFFLVWRDVKAPDVRRDGVDLGRVLTLGHQHVHLDPASYPRVLDEQP